MHEQELVDQQNGLRVRRYSWPEYEFSVALEPIAGPQAEAWPLRDRAYFEFSYAYPRSGDRRVCTFGMAVAGPPFERDFPGRGEELLDALIPLIIPMTSESFPDRDKTFVGEVPDKMRLLLRTLGSYYRHRDEPGTPEYRVAHPTALDVACWSSNPAARLTARLIRWLRDRAN